MLELNWWMTRLRWLGLAAIVISVLAWTSEFTGLVYICPYCRAQRTVIGILGILAMLPNPGHWIVRYVATVLGAFGFIVGSEQHFGGWKKILNGKFTWGDQWYINSWMLSGFALFIIVGLLLAIWAADRNDGRTGRIAYAV